MNRYPLNANPIVSVDFVDDDGDPANPTVVGLVVTKPDATVLTYTTGDLVNPAVGTWEKTLVANQLGTWSYTFTGTGAVAATSSGSFDVGPTYVTIAQVRALRDMADQGRYPDDDINAATVWFEERFEGHVGVAFLPRSATERLRGNRQTLRLLRWPVRSVVAVRSYTSPTASTAFTVEELADILIEPTGAVRRYAGGYWPADVGIDYSHCMLAAPPADVVDVALVAIREKLLEDFAGARGNRQFAVSTQDGIVRSSTPGTDRPFGIPSVDAVANDYRARYWVPAVA